MKKTFAGGLAALLVAGGLGLTAGSAQASPVVTTAVLPMAGPLPLDLCDVLPDLCASPVTGPLLEGTDTALTDLVGTSATGTPAQIQQSAGRLVDAIGATLTGVDPADAQTVANAITTQLQGAGLDPAVLTQVVTGLGLSGTDVPASTLNDLVGNVQGTVQDLASGLLGIGGQAPAPAQVQALTDQILQALAGGDPAALNTLLTGLLSSLPGGTALNASTLTGLTGQIVTLLDGATSGTASTAPVIANVTNALNGRSPAPAPAPAPLASARPTVSPIKAYVITRHPRIRGTGTAGAKVSIRTSAGKFVGSAKVDSKGRFLVVSRTLRIGKYAVSATQTAPGRRTSAKSAARGFRIVSSRPVITTKSKQKFKTHRPTIKGVGYPKTKIVLRSSSGKKLGTVRVRANGTWTIKSKKLSSGTRKVRAVQTGHGKKKTSKLRTIRIR